MSVTPSTGERLAGALRGGGRRVRFRRGQALFIEGDLADRVFVIEWGWVMITSLAPGGREIVLGLRGPGDVIGDLSALDGAPRSATALAAGEVEATVAQGSVLIGALSDAAAAMELLRVLASRLRDADRKRLEFAALDTLGRVAWRLDELSERFGEGPCDPPLPVVVVVQRLLNARVASANDWCGFAERSLSTEIFARRLEMTPLAAPTRSRRPRRPRRCRKR